jgi:hypothetical protein
MWKQATVGLPVETRSYWTPARLRGNLPILTFSQKNWAKYCLYHVINLISFVFNFVSVCILEYNTCSFFSNQLTILCRKFNERYWL